MIRSPGRRLRPHSIAWKQRLIQPKWDAGRIYPLSIPLEDFQKSVLQATITSNQKFLSAPAAPIIAQYVATVLDLNSEAWSSAKNW